MRLIDADRLKRQVEGRSWRAKGKMVELIDNSPTIRVGENTCKHRTPDGVCKLYTDEHFISFCVDGPCLNEEPITEDETPDVQHGRWEFEAKWQYKNCDGRGMERKEIFGTTKRTFNRLKCSKCKKAVVIDDTIAYAYCPHCGAKMDKEVEA